MYNMLIAVSSLHFCSDTASADELSTVKLKVGFCRLDGFLSTIQMEMNMDMV